MTVFPLSPAVGRLRLMSRRPATLTAPAGAISLAVGEPDFETPEPILDAARAALTEGHTHYADLLGDPELRELLATVLNETSRTRVEPDQVLVTHGASGALAAAVLAVVGPGDRVVLPEPTYSLYADLVALAGGEPVFVPLNDAYHLDLDSLAGPLRGARLLMFCNPANPTGAVYRRAELNGLAELLADTETLVLADEAYHELVYTDGFTSALTVPGLADRLIYCQTVSKSYAMTGFRIGYLTAPSGVFDGIAKVHRTFNGAVNSAAQRAALAAIREGPALTEPMLKRYTERRELMLDRLSSINGIRATPPEGAFYVFLRYGAPISSTELTRFLREHGVLVRAGAEYGPSGERHLRLSFAASERDIEAGIERLAQAYRCL